VCRETDLVARLGGDEFAIIQGDVAEAGDGSILATKVLKVLTEPFMLGENEAGISASMGLALAPQDGRTPHELLRKADAALYRAKHNGRAAYSYFTRALDIEARNRQRDLAALRDAVEQQSFFLVYQPNISPYDQRIVGLEALLRCSHPVLSRRPIREVIRLAQECGQMHQLSEWVLRQACSQTKSWFDQGHARFKMCLNLCARELGSLSTLDIVDRTLAHAGLHAGDLDVELTEQELFESKSDGMKVLRGLSERGVSIVLDDFGTGYSSLSYLTNLPVDQIKLDISFTRCLPQDSHVKKIVSAIINLAHALDLYVVAEGVERREQLLAMSRMKCDALQGYYFSRPMAAQLMTRWMKERGPHGL
jgi:predicted signal transduction protein with EAL and GGDEF domain